MNMKKKIKNLLFILMLCFAFLIMGCDSSDRDYDNAMKADVTESTTQENSESEKESEAEETTEEETQSRTPQIDENGEYTSKDDVALYIYTYGKLPSNFITKKEAKKLGWSGGGLDDYADDKCIGGDRFGNYEGLLPEADGRQYYECDIDTLHKNSRGAKRIVYSNDGLIYYTEDHYSSFELLYE